MSKTRRALNRAARRVAAATEAEGWRQVDDPDALRLHRRRSAVFPDIDAMEGLIGALEGASGDAASVTHANASRNWIGAGAANEIARLPARADRSHVTITGTRNDGPWATVDPATVSKPDWQVTLSMSKTEFYLREHSTSGRAFARSMTDLVDRFVVNASRGARTVIEPISLEEAGQRAYESKIATRAARVGGWWGAVGGAVVGGLVTAVVNIVTASPAP
ncbi:hypothetical protein RDI86_02070 [Cellulosimicrobium sp. XJ-DQ-B-000]|uniref:hypothetical protein n=1 Tax=Cellulosimicrobium sp. XJ-DQ-B-000 TaxID=3072182 RepID=UPI002809669F|nr:hypothetical protein [Cellulosimicrobium sp. XJ-DQ-B-000]MDQ8040634.1 hypothetical protein [Cellulosimicrobium sp. XJ-DQ-B-000]